MEHSSDGGLNNNAAVALTGKLTVAAIIAVFVVVVFILLVHWYSNRLRWRAEDPPLPAHRHPRRRRRFVFVQGLEPASAAARRGLEPSVLNTLPAVIFRSDEFKDGLECSVCLSELVDGEKARLLPKCNHGFHVDCIDMWFQSHATCPLCRNPITAPEVSGSAIADDLPESTRLSNTSSFRSLEEGFESPNFLAGVSPRDNETRVNSSSGCLVIDIPRQEMGNRISSVSPSTSGCTQEELKSPMTTRLRSLKRLLSRERERKLTPTTSGDVEQGGR